MSLKDLLRQEQPGAPRGTRSNHSSSAGIIKDTTSAPAALRGRLFKYDVSLRVSQMSDFVLSLRAALTQRGHRVYLPHPQRQQGQVLQGSGNASNSVEDEAEVGSLDLCCFGHIGDGNLHLNVLLRRGTEATIRALQSDLDSIVYAEVIRLGGMHDVYVVVCLVPLCA